MVMALSILARGQTTPLNTQDKLPDGNSTLQEHTMYFSARAILSLC